MALTAANLHDSQVGHGQNLVGKQHVIFVAVAKPALLTATPGENFLLRRNAHRVQTATLYTPDLELHTVLLDEKRSRVQDRLHVAEAEGSILAITPREHVLVGGQSENVTDSTGDLHYFRGEPRKSYNRRSRYNLHPSLLCFKILLRFRACVVIHKSLVFVLRLRNRQFLVEGEQLDVALAVHEELVGLLLEAEGEVFELVQRNFLVGLIDHFRDDRDFIKGCDSPIGELIDEILSLDQHLRRVYIVLAQLVQLTI